MSTCVLFNLLIEFGKKITCKALLSILLVIPNKFNKFKITGARLQDSVYHMTLKLGSVLDFLTKTLIFHHK